MKKSIGILLIVLSTVLAVSAQTTAFTYQGSLNTSGTPATGNHDFEFALFDLLSGGTQQGATLTRSAVAVAGGTFAVNLDFGSQFPGANRFLEIRVRQSGGGVMTTLSPRQLVNSAPYSVKSLSAETATNATQLGGVAASQYLQTNGNGSGLTNLNAGSITTGTLNNARLGVVPIANGGTGSPAQNFVDLTSAQTIGGTKTFTNPINGNGSGLTNLNGANLSDGSVTQAKLAYGATSQYDAQFVATLRWDLILPIKRIDFQAGNDPFAIAFDGANMWITNYLDNTVTKLRASDGANLGTYPVGTNPRAIAFDGANVWVLNNGSGNVTKLRASDGANLGSFAVGSNPQGIAFDGANIWTVNQDSDNVTKLRASDGANLGTIAVVASPRAVAFDGANMWVASFGDGSPLGNLRKLRASDNANLGTFSSCRTPVEMAFDGVAKLFVTCSVGTANLARILVSNGSLFGDAVAGAGVLPPSGIAFDGVNMWIAGSTQNKVSKIGSGCDAAAPCLFSTDISPRGVAFDGRSIWVTNYGRNTVTRLTEFR